MILNGLVTLLFFVIRLLCGASYCFGILSKGGAKFYFGCVVPGCFCIVAFLFSSRGELGRSRNESGMTGFGGRPGIAQRISGILENNQRG